MSTKDGAAAAGGEPPARAPAPPARAPEPPPNANNNSSSGGGGGRGGGTEAKPTAPARRTRAREGAAPKPPSSDNGDTGSEASPAASRRGGGQRTPLSRSQDNLQAAAAQASSGAAKKKTSAASRPAEPRSGSASRRAAAGEKSVTSRSSSKSQTPNGSRENLASSNKTTRVAAAPEKSASSRSSSKSQTPNGSRENLASSNKTTRLAAAAAPEKSASSKSSSKPQTPNGSRENLASSRAKKEGAAKTKASAPSARPRTTTRGAHPSSRQGPNSNGMKKASSHHSIAHASSPSANSAPSPGGRSHFRVPTGPAPRSGRMGSLGRYYSSDVLSAASAATAGVMRRAASSNSVNGAAGSARASSKDRNSQRASAQTDVMVYNAELLANFEKEKRTKEARISELQQLAENRLGELEKVKYEVKRIQAELQVSQDDAETWRLASESLRLQLSELGAVPRGDHETDAQKLAALQQARATDGGGGGRRSPSPSQATNFSSTAPQAASTRFAMSDHDGASDIPASLDHRPPSSQSLERLDSPHWDRCSSRSSEGLDDINVACLQDKIQRMEEHTYSQTEELQATLQELGDLQNTVNDLSYENERLGDERELLLESLCSQTEKLEHTRMQVQRLKALLLSDPNDTNKSERELQLTELLHSAQVEKDELILRQGELSSNLRNLDSRLCEAVDENRALGDRCSLQKDKLWKTQAEKKELEHEATELKQIANSAEMEVTRLRNLLDVERSKTSALEQRQSAVERSELEALLDSTRKELSDTERALAESKGKLQREQTSVENLRAQLAGLRCDNEAKDARWRSSESELQLLLEKAERDLHEAEARAERARQEAMRDGEEALEKQRRLEKEAKEARTRTQDLARDLEEQKRRYESQGVEWQQFQSDLQTAVVVANAFRSDALKDLERLEEENAQLRERLAHLASVQDKAEEEISSLQLELTHRQQSSPARSPGALLESLETRGRVRSAVGRELSMLRSAATRQQPQMASVKNLIQSIEEQVKGGSTERSSMSGGSLESLKSAASDTRTPLISSPAAAAATVTLRRRASGVERPRTIGHRHTVTGILFDPSARSPADVAATKASPKTEAGDAGTPERKLSSGYGSILSSSGPSPRRPTALAESENGKKVAEVTRDPLASLVKSQGGSKRNALLKWVQHKTHNYNGIDVTNFSSSWNDGLAFCALVHSYLPDKVPYRQLLQQQDKRENFTVAFEAAESVGIPSILNTNDMVAIERPDWQAVMAYVTSVYKHFETDI